MTIADTSPTIKLRWEETIIRVVEAEVPVDQLPDRLIDTDEDGWEIRTGDVDSHVVADFLDALDMAGSAHELSAEVESRYISDDQDEEGIAAIQVAAPPVPAVAEPSISATRMLEYAEEVADLTNLSVCEQMGEHQKTERHSWIECPLYIDNGSIE